METAGETHVLDVGRLPEQGPAQDVSKDKSLRSRTSDVSYVLTGVLTSAVRLRLRGGD